ncbi:hypothetical protein EVAR_73220_1 [Eumeta japonica]|uniref:Uncharacterized protein n=1 Tax=Eumeta variegata TaxID=151549 RepID=A0A4C1T3P2_EUMVA|nr:hypothetical protein EVAR_73220_1 [Eumeta japonica]
MAVLTDYYRPTVSQYPSGQMFISATRFRLRSKSDIFISPFWQLIAAILQLQRCAIGTSLRYCSNSVHIYASLDSPVANARLEGAQRLGDVIFKREGSGSDPNRGEIDQ